MAEKKPSASRQLPAELRRALPLLAVAGADVRAWLVARGQDWVEDPTNTDQRYTRNRIRAQL